MPNEPSSPADPSPPYCNEIHPETNVIAEVATRLLPPTAKPAVRGERGFPTLANLRDAEGALVTDGQGLALRPIRMGEVLYLDQPPVVRTADSLTDYQRGFRDAALTLSMQLDVRASTAHSDAAKAQRDFAQRDFTEAHHRSIALEDAAALARRTADQAGERQDPKSYARDPVTPGYRRGE